MAEILPKNCQSLSLEKTPFCQKWQNSIRIRQNLKNFAFFAIFFVDHNSVIFKATEPILDVLKLA